MKTRIASILTFFLLAATASCAGSSESFCDWTMEEFGTAAITESVTKTITLGNASSDAEQHLLAVELDPTTNIDGHFRVDAVKVGDQEVAPTDIVVPPGSALSVVITYAPTNLESTRATWGGWFTGQPRRWVPVSEEEYERQQQEQAAEPVIHRAILQAVYDHPNEGIFYVQVVGNAKPGPNGEEATGGGSATCTPGGGTACYTGGFLLDLPTLSPGGPKPLEMTGPIRMAISGGAASMRMDDFPYVLFYLRSEEIPQLPAGVTATLIISGGQGAEAAGTFDGARLSLSDVVFRIRMAMGELSVDQVKQGIAAIVDFEVPDLTIETIAPLNQGAITLRLETSLEQNPSGNELFDQFLSGAKVIAVLEGELAF